MLLIGTSFSFKNIYNCLFKLEESKYVVLVSFCLLTLLSLTRIIDVALSVLLLCTVRSENIR